MSVHAKLYRMAAEIDEEAEHVSMASSDYNTMRALCPLLYEVAELCRKGDHPTLIRLHSVACDPSSAGFKIEGRTDTISGAQAVEVQKQLMRDRGAQSLEK